MIHAFSNLEKLIGPERLAARKKLAVGVIGLGGIGSWAAEALVRSGVGTIVLIDLDEICQTNINRQLHALHSQVGKSKALVLKERLQDINPEVKIEVHLDFITKETLHLLKSPLPLQGVIDAIDSLAPKCSLIDYAFREQLPLIITGGAAGRENPWDITTRDLMKTFQDPLLFQVRKRLRLQHQFPKTRTSGMTAIFCPQTAVAPSCENNPPEFKVQGRGCEGPMGSSVLVTANMGLLAAYELLKQLQA